MHSDSVARQLTFIHNFLSNVADRQTNQQTRVRDVHNLLDLGNEIITTNKTMVIIIKSNLY